MIVFDHGGCFMSSVVVHVLLLLYFGIADRLIAVYGRS